MALNVIQDWNIQFEKQYQDKIHLAEEIIEMIGSFSPKQVNLCLK